LSGLGIISPVTIVSGGLFSMEEFVHDNSTGDVALKKEDGCFVLSTDGEGLSDVLVFGLAVGYPLSTVLQGVYQSSSYL
jgi:hypothetical protein